LIMENQEWMNDFKINAIYRIDESTRMFKKCMDNLDEAELWKRPNASSNSAGNLVLHLCGNIRQYISASLAGNADNRQRNEEFSTEGGLNKLELASMLENTIEEAKSHINSCSEKELLRKRSVQGFQLSGLGIIMHVVEHYSYHTGQLAYWTKLLKDKDLRFYEGLDLNIKNEE